MYQERGGRVTHKRRICGREVGKRGEVREGEQTKTRRGKHYKRDRQKNCVGGATADFRLPS